MHRATVTISILLLACVTFGQGHETPCAKHIEVPTYPSLARMAQLQGKVAVTAMIDPDGNVTQVEAEGIHKLLCDEAKENIEAWKFNRPAKAPLALIVFYEYKLEGEPAREYAGSRVTFDLPSKVTVVAHPPTAEQLSASIHD